MRGPSPGWRAPAPGAHGGEGPRLAEALGVDPKEVLDLSASLNPAAPDVVGVLARHLESVRHYPDAARATCALSEAMGVPSELLVLCAGGAEAIRLVAAIRPEGWVQEPEFSLYRRHLRALRPEAGRWRSNPNNPTGLLASPEEQAAVWDEAFWPLSQGSWTRGDALAGRAVVVGSLTKLFACPGLRLGYVLCPDEATAEALRGAQAAWPVGSLALAALPELLEMADLEGWAARVGSLRAELANLLEGHGLAWRPSCANWLLVEAPSLRQRLARHAIAVRDCASFGLEGVVRVAVPNEAGLERLGRALAAVGEEPW
jgi:histidinol-phosphate/aromatic aminotransferase/cobyric acid decarboxylase-like protein